MCMHYSTERHEYINDDEVPTTRCPKQEAHDEKFMCIFLGVFFSLFGVLIAAIIAKGYGVRKAFLGIAARWFFMILVFLIVLLAQSSSSSGPHIINRWDENGIRLE